MILLDISQHAQELVQNGSQILMLELKDWSEKVNLRIIKLEWRFGCIQKILSPCNPGILRPCFIHSTWGR